VFVDGAVTSSSYERFSHIGVSIPDVPDEPEEPDVPDEPLLPLQIPSHVIVGVFVPVGVSTAHIEVLLLAVTVMVVSVPPSHEQSKYVTSESKPPAVIV